MLPSGYRPELDVSPYCDDESGNFYQHQVGILQWIVELGCIDIGTEVSMMASYSMTPIEGHLQAVLHMLMYLSTHQRSTLVLDPSYNQAVIGEVSTWKQRKNIQQLHMDHWADQCKLQHLWIWIIQGT